MYTWVFLVTLALVRLLLKGRLRAKSFLVEICLTRPLECPYDQIVDFHFFFHFPVQYDFLTHLAKFQSIMNIRSPFLFTFISDNLRPPLLDLVPRLGCELEKMTSYAQKYLTG